MRRGLIDTGVNNPRAAAALQKTGWVVEKIFDGVNLVYELLYHNKTKPIRCSVWRSDLGRRKNKDIEPIFQRSNLLLEFLR